MVWIFNWLHGWVYVNTILDHLHHVLLQKGTGKGNGKGKGKVKGKFSKGGTDSTVIGLYKHGCWRNVLLFGGGGLGSPNLLLLFFVPLSR